MQQRRQEEQQQLLWTIRNSSARGLEVRRPVVAKSAHPVEQATAVDKPVTPASTPGPRLLTGLGRAGNGSPATPVSRTDEGDVVADCGGSVGPVLRMEEEVAEIVPRQAVDGESHRCGPARPEVSVCWAIKQRVAERGGGQPADTWGWGGADMAGWSAISKWVVSTTGESPRSR